MSTPLIHRETYRPSGIVGWLRSPLLLLIPLNVAWIAAAVLCWLFNAGWYLIILVPMVIGAIVGVCVALTVGVSRLRRRTLAFLLGAMTGALAFVGSYHLQMVSLFGPAMITRIDALPWFIEFRLQSDVQNDAARPDDPNEQPQYWMNLMLFLFEGGSMTLIPATMAAARAGRVYDDQSRCWAKKESRTLATGLGQAVLDHLGRTPPGGLDQIVRISRGAASPGDVNASQCSVTLEYVSDEDHSPLARPIYLSVTDPTFNTRWLDKWTGRGGNLKQAKLTYEEAVAVTPLFERFEQSLAKHHPELRPVPGELAARPGGGEFAASATATVTEVDESHRPGVFRGKHLLIENIIGGSPLLMLAAAAGLCGLAYWLHPQIGLPGSIAVAAPGVLLGLIGVYVSQACPTTPESLYTRAVCRGAIGQRLDRLVDPADPEALFVVFSDRSRWEKIKLETCTDAGFAKITDDGTFLYEGDAFRLTVPRGAIIGCQTVPMSMPIDPSRKFWMVALEIQTPAGPVEHLVAQSLESPWRSTNGTRRRAAERLAGRLMVG